MEQELASGIRKIVFLFFKINCEEGGKINVEQELASGIGKSVNMEGRSTPKSNFDEEETGQVD